MNVTKISLRRQVAAGDVVTLSGGDVLMTVEAIRSETFGVVLDCVWFDRDDALRFVRQPLNSVDLFSRPNAPFEISKGMEVRLRSRGPVMTVLGFDVREGTSYAKCLWNGPSGRERQRLLPVSALVLTIMERFEGPNGRSI